MSKKKEFSFPTVSLCPRCKGSQTRAVSTQGKIQYRVCQAPICRHRYPVTGTPVKPFKPQERKEQHNEQETKQSTAASGLAAESSASAANNPVDGES